MSAVITTQQQTKSALKGLKSAIKKAVKARNAKLRLHKRSLKNTLKELRKTTKKVGATSTSASIKKKPAKKAGIKKVVNKSSTQRIYRMIEKVITKKGKKVNAKVWRSEKTYELKEGEKWLDIWAIDTRKPTKGSHVRVNARPTIVEKELATIADIAAADDIVEASKMASEVVEAAKILAATHPIV